MDIANLLKEDLWDTIKSSYQSEDYTTAILNSISYLRDTIREKSDSELDGVDLINKAFSGNDPKIKVNKLQTKNDINVQKGLRELLSGVYTHIRNPRSHDKYVDTKEDAISIILFLNYLLGIIDKSKSSFQKEDFIARVYDEYFVDSEKYAELLVNEIPNKEIENTFYALYSSIKEEIYIKEEIFIQQQSLGDSYNRKWVDDYRLRANHRKIKSLKLVMSMLLKKLDNEKENIFEKISHDLKSMPKDNELFSKIIIFLTHWNSFNELVQLRTIHLLTQNEKDEDVLEYQRIILVEGWKFFNSQEKEIIEKAMIFKLKDFSLENGELICDHISF